MRTRPGRPVGVNTEGSNDESALGLGDTTCDRIAHAQGQKLRCARTWSRTVS